MNCLSVRDVLIGEGRPKICVSMLSSTKEELVADAMALLNMPIDLVEWRADWFKDVLDHEAVLDVLKNLRRVLGNIPLIFTIRTALEGGEIAVDEATYLDITLQAITSGSIDMVDVEIFRGEETAIALIEAAHANQVKTIGSFHDFTKTPTRETLLLIIQKMQTLGVNLSKVAVMPETKTDSIQLLSTTLEIAENLADRPFVLIGMGQLGIITRMFGGMFGSAITFGAAEKTSAPGQVPLERLAQVLELLEVPTSV